MRLHGPLIAALMCVVAISSSARAEGAGDRSVTLIVPFLPCGGNDVLARAIAPLIASRLGPGVEVSVQNRPGAGGEIGWGALVDAPLDGRTIGMIVDPVIQAIPIEREARFSLDRIDPLVALARDPVVWSVAADSPFKSVRDAIVAARAKPGKVGVATSGVGSDDDLGVLLVERATGVRFAHIPFEGGTADAAAASTHKVHIVAHNLGEALRATRDRHLRILGVMSRTSEPAAPGVPTFMDAGVDSEMAAVRGIGAPRGVPAAERERLVEAILGAARDPVFVEKALEDHQFPRVLGPVEYATEIADNDKRYRALWNRTPWGR